MAYFRPTTRRRERHERMTKILANATLGAVLGVFLGLMGVEVIAGCGEVSYYPDGSWSTNQCVWLHHITDVQHRSGEWEMQDVEPVHNYHPKPQGDTTI